MITLRPAKARDTARILEIWRKAVDATHDFLHRADRAAIEEEVTAFLPEAALTLAVDASDKPLGFMFLHEGHMEALFIDPDYHGRGIGKALVQAALAAHPALTTDVNEQNTQAMGFIAGSVSSRRDAPTSTGRDVPIRSSILGFAQPNNKPRGHGSSGGSKPRTPSSVSQPRIFSPSTASTNGAKCAAKACLA